jgi:hypothetical protein
MKKGFLCIGLALIVAAGITFTVCGKNAGPDSAEKLCRMAGDAAGEAAKSRNPKAKPAALKKIVDESAKGCMSKFAGRNEREKAAASKQAEKMLAKCKDKKGRDFSACIGNMKQKKTKDANKNKIHLDKVKVSAKVENTSATSSFTVKTPEAAGGVRGVKK